jgi:molybdenum cofactor biosynthesis enzyme MoaA
MQIQSLSIAVPAGCPNKCKFCVSGMHDNIYPNLISGTTGDDKDFAELQYRKRLQFARDNGCNTIMLTGSGEPLMNRAFLEIFATWNQMLKNPFVWIEMQTSGVGLDYKYAEVLRHFVGVSTISLSLSDMFDDVSNGKMNGTPQDKYIGIKQVCNIIKGLGMNLRLSLNMTDVYNDIPVESIFDQARFLCADQITFRELYQSGDPELEQNKWIEEHACNYTKLFEIEQYIVKNGNPLEYLPYGARKYSVKGMSVVIDNDCMSKDSKDVLKYLILRPNCKLYSRWDDKGSLIF